LRVERPPGRTLPAIGEFDARPSPLVDVDGVVSLFEPGPLPCAVDAVPHLLSPQAGNALRRLADAEPLPRWANRLRSRG
jgi:hypothetical protein